MLFDLPDVAKTSFGQLMGKGMHKRKENDYYPTTDEECTWALLAAIGDAIEGWSVMTGLPIEFHEPACGKGDISRILESLGYPVLSTDLFEGSGLVRVYPLSWRPDFTGEGSPPMECCWYEFQPGYTGEAIYGPILRRPKNNLQKCKNTLDLFDEGPHT